MNSIVISACMNEIDLEVPVDFGIDKIDISEIEEGCLTVFFDFGANVLPLMDSVFKNNGSIVEMETYEDENNNIGCVSLGLKFEHFSLFKTFYLSDAFRFLEFVFNFSIDDVASIFGCNVTRFYRYFVTY